MQFYLHREGVQFILRGNFNGIGMGKQPIMTAFFHTRVSSSRRYTVGVFTPGCGGIDGIPWIFHYNIGIEYTEVRSRLYTGNYPIFPVKYDFVRSSEGEENIVAVSPYSANSPRYINIERDDIRIACPILWVTISMVKNSGYTSRKPSGSWLLL